MSKLNKSLTKLPWNKIKLLTELKGKLIAKTYNSDQGNTVAEQTKVRRYRGRVVLWKSEGYLTESIGPRYFANV